MVREFIPKGGPVRPVDATPARPPARAAVDDWLSSLDDVLGPDAGAGVPSAVQMAPEAWLPGSAEPSVDVMRWRSPCTHSERAREFVRGFGPRERCRSCGAVVAGVPDPVAAELGDLMPPCGVCSGPGEQLGGVSMCGPCRANNREAFELDTADLPTAQSERADPWAAAGWIEAGATLDTAGQQYGTFRQRWITGAVDTSSVTMTDEEFRRERLGEWPPADRPRDLGPGRLALGPVGTPPEQLAELLRRPIVHRNHPCPITPHVHADGQVRGAEPVYGVQDETHTWASGDLAAWMERWAAGVELTDEQRGFLAAAYRADGRMAAQVRTPGRLVYGLDVAGGAAALVAARVSDGRVTIVSTAQLGRRPADPPASLAALVDYFGRLADQLRPAVAAFGRAMVRVAPDVSAFTRALHRSIAQLARVTRTPLRLLAAPQRRAELARVRRVDTAMRTVARRRARRERRARRVR